MKLKFESKVNNLLEQFSINRAPVPVEKIALKLNLAVKSTDLGEGVSGALIIKDGKATIGVSQNDPLVRRRFTIAHEIGHYILHNKADNKLFVDTQVLFRNEESSLGEKQKEREANAFAAALLMPINILKREIDETYDESEYTNDDDYISYLAKTFKVSEIAMTYRLSNLGFI